MRGHDRIAQRLVNAEPAANPKMRDCDGKTPEKLARETGHASVAKFLKEWVELWY